MARPTSSATGRVNESAVNLTGVARNDTPITIPIHTHANGRTIAAAPTTVALTTVRLTTVPPPTRPGMARWWDGGSVGW